jgi:hypothetical protein
MITDLEDAVAAVVTRALLQNTTLAAVPYVVRSSTTAEEVPGDRSVIAVRIQQGDRTLVALLDAIAEIFVATPSQNENTSIANHRLLERAVERIFSPGLTITVEEEQLYIGELLNQEIENRLTEYVAGGYFNEGWQPGREDTGWMPSLRVKIGVVRQIEEIEENGA